MYTILNPHISDFLADPVLYKYAKRRPLRKYSYLITEQIKQHSTVRVLINSATSGIIPMGVYIKLPYFLRLLFSKIEIKLWKKRNNFGPEVEVYYDSKYLKKKDVLIFFAYKNYKNGKALIKTAKEFEKSIMHLSHYHNDTSKLSSLVSQISNISLAADVDIAANKYFSHFFSWYKKPIFIMPFAVEDRFVVRKPWVDRKDKALSIGTFHFLEKDFENGKRPELIDFLTYSGQNTLHPLRREIFERKDELVAYIDCSNSPYIETKKSKSLFRLFTPTNLLAGQKKYFSFDIVEKFNDYKFVIVGEELASGLPGIGSFEALACGCVVLGDRSCYTGVEGKNLILVDGLTVEKAIEKMKEINEAETYKCDMYDGHNYDKVITGLQKLSSYED